VEFFSAETQFTASSSFPFLVKASVLLLCLTLSVDPVAAETTVLYKFNDDWSTPESCGLHNDKVFAVNDLTFPLLADTAISEIDEGSFIQLGPGFIKGKQPYLDHSDFGYASDSMNSCYPVEPISLSGPLPDAEVVIGTTPAPTHTIPIPS